MLRENNYSMQQGGISVIKPKGAKDAKEEAKGHKRRVQQAGRDYSHMDYCQVCAGRRAWG